MSTSYEPNGSDPSAADVLARSSSLAAQLGPPIVGLYDPARTGDAAVDGVISGYRWPADTAIHYGFPTTKDVYPMPYGGVTGDDEFDHGFAPASQFAQETFDAFITGVRSGSVQAMTLTPIMGFTNIDLVKDAVATASTHTLIATSSQPSTAWAYYPGEKFGVREGDLWLGQSYPEYITPANGSYGAYIMMHEFGHTLGLKHSFDLNENEDVTVPFDKDFFEYTIMSYSMAPYVTPAGGFTPAEAAPAGPESTFLYAYPQTYMMLDIAALQHMYGANYNFRSGDDTYTWSPTTGEVFVDGISQGRAGATDSASTFVSDEIFQTIWDGGGVDTYDLSNYSTDLKLDLEPGQYSTFSEIQQAYLGTFPYPEPYHARGNVYNSLLYNDDPRSLIENAKGGSGSDVIKGNQADNHLWGNGGNDTLQGGSGNDTLEGASGTNTAVFSGPKASYTIVSNPDGSTTISDTRAGQDGTDLLKNIQFAQFSDQTLALSGPATNQAPTGIALSKVSLLENSPGGTVIGTLTASDPDAGNTFTYAVRNDPDSKFQIVGDQLELRSSATLDYETATSHQVTVRVTDQGGLTYDRIFTIAVTNVNEAPTDITLSNASVQENSPGGTLVGLLGAADPDANGTFTYTLANDPDSTFQIVDNQLRVRQGAVLDYEAAISHQVTVHVADQGGLTYDKTFTITVGDVDESSGNHAPTDIALSNAAVPENSPGGTAVGTLSATDSDAGDTFIYSLAGDPDNVFQITGDQLQVRQGASLDYEAATSHQVVVRVMDQGGLVYDKVFTIAVGDVDDTHATPVPPPPELPSVLIGTAHADRLSGGSGREKIYGLAGNDALSGGGGNDTLYGGAGRDVLTGGSGQDVFVFNTRPNRKTNVDKITDFNPKDDTIWLDNKYFAKLGKGSGLHPGKLNKGFFTLGEHAKDKNDHVIYDNKKGILWYDADGSGHGKAVEIATLKKGLHLTYKDFLVV